MTFTVLCGHEIMKTIKLSENERKVLEVLADDFDDSGFA
jgi:hypothetical protein